MGKERLCDFCQKFDYCQFVAVAKQIAESVPKGAGRDEAQAAHDKIAFAREEARQRRCPQTNEVNPDYSGKELL